MRFIVASDGHYGQPNTDFKQFHTDLISWVNREKMQKGVDFLFFNGDLIHDDPTLLYDFKNTISNLSVPFYVSRGNHDKVGLDVWQSTWGYPTNHSFAKGEYAFMIGDTCVAWWSNNQLRRLAERKQQEREAQEAEWSRMKGSPPITPEPPS
jgi:DNA repair exonuclease SbcCD nuclease subunit